MNAQQLSRIQLYFTGSVTIIILALLIWQHFTDGVPSHHLFQSADYPAMSNWWGALILPTLSWLLLGRINNRILLQSNDESQGYPSGIIIGFVCALLYGTLISVFFAHGRADISGLMSIGILIIALFLKVYREEYVLGYIISMSIVFGAVIPTIFGPLFAIISALLYHIVHFIWSRASLWFLRKKNSQAG